MTNHDHHDDAMMAFKLKPELSTVSFSATDNVPSNFPGRLGVTVTVTEVKTPLDIYLQRHSPPIAGSMATLLSPISTLYQPACARS